MIMYGHITRERTSIRVLFFLVEQLEGPDAPLMMEAFVLDLTFIALSPVATRAYHRVAVLIQNGDSI